MVFEARIFPKELVPVWAAGLAGELREHDILTYNHSVRTGLITRGLWRMRLPTAMDTGTAFVSENDMLLAGLLHDISKKEVSAAILDKRGALTAEEADLLATHPFTSAATVAPYETKIADIIRGHHRFGKNGVIYPRYENDSDAQSAMQRPGYAEVEVAQRILAIADKADVAINRVRGIQGTSVESEMDEMRSRFQKELREGLIREEWLYFALQLAWEMGDYELVLNGR